VIPNFIGVITHSITKINQDHGKARNTTVTQHGNQAPASLAPSKNYLGNQAPISTGDNAKNDTLERNLSDDYVIDHMKYVCPPIRECGCAQTHGCSH